MILCPWLYGMWRFSDVRAVRYVSRVLCRLSKHVWLYYDGRPVNCMVCGRIGHTVAWREFGAKLDGMIRARMENAQDSGEMLP